MLDTIEIFDVNQLKGMSTAIFRLTQADTTTVSNELRTIFNFGGEAADASGSIIRFVPIERINAILVITPQARYLNTVEQWVNRHLHHRSMLQYQVRCKPCLYCHTHPELLF